MTDLRILILADDPLVRAGLALLLERQAEVVVVGREGTVRMKAEGGRMKENSALADVPMPNNSLKIRGEVFRYDAILWDLGHDPEKALEQLEKASEDLDLEGMGPVVWLAPESTELTLELLAGLLGPASTGGFAGTPGRRQAGRGILQRETSAGRMVQTLKAASAGLCVWEAELLKGEGIKDKGERGNRENLDLSREEAGRGIREGAESGRAGYREGIEAFDTAVVETGETLTPREAEVLRLVADGLPNKAIAGRLGISEHTVKFHLNTILGKLQASSRTEAVTRAARLGWIIL